MSILLKCACLVLVWLARYKRWAAACIDGERSVHAHNYRPHWQTRVRQKVSLEVNVGETKC
jgi:hypothetical protein